MNYIRRLSIEGFKKFSSLEMNFNKHMNTVDTACVILTDKFEKLDADEFSVDGIPVPTINKLYVAMTRSKGDLFLIKASVFKKYKNRYLV